MATYKNITSMFNEKYSPFKTLVIFKSNRHNSPPYIESYDMDESGCPINAHPLTLNETIQLRKSLTIEEEIEGNAHLTAEQIIPENLLHVSYSEGHVIWHTPPQRKYLQFTKNTGLIDGDAYVPAMIWKATKKKLFVWARAEKKTKRPTKDEQLFKAPFFNIYADGSVCMGSVEAFPEKSKHGLEYFIEYWEAAFWNSTFSHLNVNISPVKGNIVQLWNEILNTDKPFPTDNLLPENKTLIQILKQ